MPLNTKPKLIRFSEDEHHYMNVLKNVYNINPSAYIRKAFVTQLKKDILEIRKEFNEKKNRLPF